MSGRSRLCSILVFLICFAAAAFLNACQRDGNSADIEPDDIEAEEIIGRVELPDLVAGGQRYVDTRDETPPESAPAMAPIPEEVNTELPEFGEYADVSEKKEDFFDFLRPIIQKENQKVLRERGHVLLLWDRYQAEDALSAREIESIDALAEKYRVDASYDEGEEFFMEMLLRIDKIPESLALIQAATESGWGTSHFAREGNNLFGQWCFSEGCGIVPRRRPEGATYEVRAFDDVGDSVRAYILNLNRHPAYSDLRRMRYRMRLAGKQPDAELLAGGLEQYAEIGMQYVNTLQQMIRGNERFMGIHEPASES